MSISVFHKYDQTATLSEVEESPQYEEIRGKENLEKTDHVGSRGISKTTIINNIREIKSQRKYEPREQKLFRN